MRHNANTKSGQKIQPGRSPNADNEFFGNIFHGPNAFSFEQEGGDGTS